MTIGGVERGDHLTDRVGPSMVKVGSGTPHLSQGGNIKAVVLVNQNVCSHNFLFPGREIRAAVTQAALGLVEDGSTASSRHVGHVRFRMRARNGFERFKVSKDDIGIPIVQLGKENGLQFKANTLFQRPPAALPEANWTSIDAPTE